MLQAVMDGLLQGIVQQLVNGLAVGGLYITFAIGMTLIYSVLRILHIAHGTMLLIGAYSSLLLLPFFGNNIVITLAFGTLIAGGLGTLMGMGVYLPLLKKRQYDAILISSVAILLASQEALLVMFGVRHQEFPFPVPINSISVTFFGISVFVIQLVCAAVALVSMSLLWLFLSKTNEGRGLKALDQDPKLAELCGISPLKLNVIALLIGSLLGGLSGGLLSLYYNDVSPGIALYPVNIALAVQIVGGLGSVPGTMIAGLLMGLLETFAIAYIPLTFPRTLVSFIVLIVILLIRPRGILGKGR